MTYGVFGGTLNLAQFNSAATEPVWWWTLLKWMEVCEILGSFPYCFGAVLRFLYDFSANHVSEMHSIFSGHF